MKQQYAEWITNLDGDQSGKCQIRSRQMRLAFPELTVVRGVVRVRGPFGTLHTTPHWWCEDELVMVVDPTATQFIEVIGYNTLSRDLADIIGKCANCGEYFTGPSIICSQTCRTELMEYLK